MAIMIGCSFAAIQAHAAMWFPFLTTHSQKTEGLTVPGRNVAQENDLTFIGLLISVLAIHQILLIWGFQHVESILSTK